MSCDKGGGGIDENAVDDLVATVPQDGDSL
jgi:hypothetical protein